MGGVAFRSIIKDKEDQTMHLRGRRWLTWLVMASLFASLPSPVLAQKKTIRIGIPDSFSGIAAEFVRDKLDGAKLAVEEINAKGGLLGRKIELVLRDDQLRPPKGVENMIDLYDREKVDFVVGMISSAVLLATSQWAKEHKKLLFAWDARTQKATDEQGHRYLVRSLSNTYMDGLAMATFFSKQPWTKYATISPDYEYGHSVVENFEMHMKHLKPGFQIVHKAWPKLGEIDFSLYITSILNAAPEVLYVGLWGGDAMTFIKQAKPYGLFDKMQVIFLHGGMSLLMPVGNAMPENVWAGTNYVFTIETPENKAFVERFKARYGRVPTDYNYLGYAAFQILAAGIRKARSLDQEKVINALEGLTVKLPAGPVTIRAFDHQGDMGLYIVKTVKDPSYPQFLIPKVVEYVGGEKILRPIDEVKKLRGG